MEKSIKNNISLFFIMIYLTACTSTQVPDEEVSFEFKDALNDPISMNNPTPVQVPTENSQFDSNFKFNILSSYALNNSKAAAAGKTRNKGVPPILLLHHTAIDFTKVGANQRGVSQEKNPDRTASVHFGIQNNGTVDKFLNTDLAGQHIYTQLSGIHVLGEVWRNKPINRSSFGVEIYYCPAADECKLPKDQEPSDAQVQSLAKLMIHLEKEFQITPNKVFFHGEVQPTKDGERENEPRYLVFNPLLNGQISINQRWYTLIGLVRAGSGYKTGEFASMSDKDVAMYILKNNFKNAMKTLEQYSEGGSPRYLRYKKFLEANP